MSAFTRIKKLIYLQRIEKVKILNFSSIKSLILSLVIKLAIVTAVAVGLTFLLRYANSITAFNISVHLLSFFLIAFCTITFFAALFGSLNTFYGAKDNQFLLSLPVQPGEVFFSKLVLLIFQQVISGIIIFTPLLLGFAFGANGAFFQNLTMEINVYFWIGAILFSFLLPLFITLLGVLVSLPVKMLVDFIKRRKILVIISFVLIFALFIFVFNFLVTAVMNSINFFSELVLLAHHITVFVGNISNGSFLFFHLANSMNSPFMFLAALIIIGASVIVVLPIYFLIRPNYLRIAVGGGESRKKQARDRENKRPIRSKRPLLSIINRDIQMLMNHPASFFNNFTVLVAMPFIVLLVNRLFGILELRAEGGALLIGINVAMISLFTLIGNNYSATAISREGRNLYLVKTSPVSFKKYSFAKIVTNFAFSTFFLIFTSLIILFTTELSFISTLAIFTYVSILNLGHIIMSLERDLRKADTDWYDESEIRKSRNIEYSLTTGALVGLVFGGLAFKFYLVTSLTMAFVYLSIIAVSFFAWRASRLYGRIEYYMEKM
ncbi:MAG: hypothetical protein FWE45_00580 [Firmicutes bacterium]|nr:hypothetical protein [Bacillota bacterium]